MFLQHPMTFRPAERCTIPADFFSNHLIREFTPGGIFRAVSSPLSGIRYL